MTDQASYRYFRVCPRGFANEVTYYRVPLDKVHEVEAEYYGYNDDVDASADWTNDTRASQPGVAIDWVDRNWDV